MNVTLLFSVERYVQVIEAFLAGLEWRLDRGLDTGSLASVASFFVSRVDGKVDACSIARRAIHCGGRLPSPTPG